MDALEIWMSIVGISMALSGVPQCFRMFLRKSSEDVSAWLFIILVNGHIWWIYYAVKIECIILIITNGLSLLFIGSVFFMVFYYRKRRQTR